MNIFLSALLIVLIIFNLIFAIGNFLDERIKISFLNLLAVSLCTISFILFSIQANNKIYEIGTWIENKEVINYENRTIYLADEGCIVIPWYVNVTIDHFYPSDNYTIIANTQAENIVVYVPIEEKEIFASKQN